MNIYETLENIVKSKLIDYDLRYCLVDANKLPYTINDSLARSNNYDDFVKFDELLNCKNIDNYNGVGISIQASNICAIDVDKCFSEKFNINSIDSRGLKIIDMFKDDAYIEFSFSGTGLRILFKADLIKDYSDKYYIKNHKCKIEYYQPGHSYRYVTVTGRTLYNNAVDKCIDIKPKLIQFLDMFMLKPARQQIATCNACELLTFADAMKLIRKYYFKDIFFQNLWFDEAPGSGSNESERDFHLVMYLYSHITQNEDLLKDLFEQSPFYKSKDYKHKKKWSNQNYRYYHYVYDKVRLNYL